MTKRYYLRGFAIGKSLFVFLSITVAILLGGLIYLLATSSTAPWWTYLLFLPIYIAYIWMQLARDNYIFIDEKRGMLCGGNDLTKKTRDIATITAYFEVIYLPHTKEVKLTKGDGSRFVKLKDGKKFVEQFERAFEKQLRKESTKAAKEEAE